MIPLSHRMTLLIAAWCGLTLLAGCSDDEEKVSTSQPDLAQVVDEEDGTPVAGIKVVAMDPRSNLPLADPVVSGTDGFCNFGQLPGENHHLLVFGGVDYRVHAVPDIWYGTKDAQTLADRGSVFPSPLTPFGGNIKSTPATPAVALVRKIFPDSLPRIAGRVVAAGTGAPLGRVFVSLSPYLSGYQGETAPSDDVTLADGEFSVSQIPFGVDSQSENIFQIEPLRFTRQGYRPLIWSYDPPNGSENVDIGGVTITLEPLAPEDTGSISGMILRDGLPVADIVVGLGIADLLGKEKSGPGMPGWAGVTDQEGRYTIANLSTGTYILRPGFPLGDGVFFPNQPGNIPGYVESGHETLAPDLFVLHEIEPLNPAHGHTVGTPPDSLFWTAVPGATYYEVRFDRGVLPLTHTNAIEMPESLPISPGLHYWSVLAANESDEILGATQIKAVFRLLPQN
jgi:hypothetical protein